jgi:hypothetical protein
MTFVALALLALSSAPSFVHSWPVAQQAANAIEIQEQVMERTKISSSVGVALILQILSHTPGIHCGNTATASCYQFSTESRNWAAARADCNERGATLAVLETTSEWTVVKNIISSDSTYSPISHWWVGSNDIAVEGHWEWADVDGASIPSIWYSGQPSGGSSEDCGVLYRSAYTMHDRSCSNSERYICEYKFSE